MIILLRYQTGKQMIENNDTDAVLTQELGKHYNFSTNDGQTFISVAEYSHSPKRYCLKTNNAVKIVRKEEYNPKDSLVGKYHCQLLANPEDIIFFIAFDADKKIDKNDLIRRIDKFKLNNNLNKYKLGFIFVSTQTEMSTLKKLKTIGLEKDKLPSYVHIFSQNTLSTLYTGERALTDTAQKTLFDFQNAPQKIVKKEDNAQVPTENPKKNKLPATQTTAQKKLKRTASELKLKPITNFFLPSTTMIEDFYKDFEKLKKLVNDSEKEFINKLISELEKKLSMLNIKEGAKKIFLEKIENIKKKINTISHSK